MSDSVRPHRRQPTRLPCPWDSPGKNAGVGCHLLLQCMKVKMNSLSHVRLFSTPWTVAHQAPPSMGFSRQEYWSGSPLPSPCPSLHIHIYTHYKCGSRRPEERISPESNSYWVAQLASVQVSSPHVNFWRGGSPSASLKLPVQVASDLPQLTGRPV